MNVEVTADKDVMWDWPLQSNDEFVHVKHCLQVHDDAEHFEVGLDAKYFNPKEVEVKIIGDLLQINLEHKAKTSSMGEITREIHRCYRLPKNVDVKTLKSNLDAKGVLHIEASKFH